jgi:hypothetical protein
MKQLSLGGLLAAALLAMPLAATAQNYDPSGYGGGNRDRNLGGVIASVNGGSFQLRNGRTVFLHHGTVINPTGTRLQPGMAVSVIGYPAGNGNVNANEVDVNGPRHRHHDQDAGSGYYNH